MNVRDLFTVPPQKVAMVLFVILLAAAVFDIMYRRIPNWITVTGAVLGIAMNTAIGAPEAGLVFSLVGLLVAFGVFALLLALRAMGAGDLKLMAAVGAMIGWQRWLGLFLVTSILGGVVGLITAIATGRLKKTLFNVSFIFSEMTKGRPAYLRNEELDVKSNKALRNPYGAIIALGMIFYVAICARLNR